ncbi:MAG: flagellin, partial [Catenulispora sp.]
QFNNDTLSTDDKDAIASEVYQISQELGNIATGTKFNGNTLLEGKTFSFQVGANDSETISTTAVTLSGAIGTADFWRRSTERAAVWPPVG